MNGGWEGERGKMKRHVFIIGSKGIPGLYGGYETFVDKLTEYHQYNPNIQYHVACKGKEEKEFKYHNARCFQLKIPDIGAAQAIYYDVLALKRCCKYIKENQIEKPIIYVLACRIGPFAAYFQKKIHRLSGMMYINPDGHEWMRAKWSKPVRKYWKFSEALMVKYGDLLICDSQNIEKYIQKEYQRYKPKTIFIAYGAETRPSLLKDDNEIYTDWMKKNGIKADKYYLIVGRFVPENNFEIMIREFMSSKTKRDLVIITTVNDKFLKELERKLHFQQDKRIKFAGTVYDQELLKKIRENAYGYLHGHEVGGTNPSLLEALGSTKLNLLLDVGFNREVAEDGAVYWKKESGDLAALINKIDQMYINDMINYEMKAKQKIINSYSWQLISERYLEVLQNI